MGIVGVSFGVAVIATVAITHIDRHEGRRTHHQMASLLLLATWGLSNAMRPIMDQPWTDYLIPTLTIIGCLAAVISFEVTPAIWKLLIALLYFAQLTFYGDYLSQRSHVAGVEAMINFEFRDNLCFATQLLIVALDPARHVAQRVIDGLRYSRRWDASDAHSARLGSGHAQEKR